MGEHDTTDSEADIRTISAITDHPDYDSSNNFAYDFSILTLAEPLTFSSVVAPVCLPSLVSSLYTGRGLNGASKNFTVPKLKEPTTTFKVRNI